METNKEQIPIIQSIKVRRTEYEVKKGDHIVYNGACFIFHTGDNRVLEYKGFEKTTYITIPKSTVKTIPFEKMKKEEYGFLGMKMIKWIF